MIDEVEEERGANTLEPPLTPPDALLPLYEVLRPLAKFPSYEHFPPFPSVPLYTLPLHGYRQLVLRMRAVWSRLKGDQSKDNA